MLSQKFECGRRMASLKQFQEFVEQSGRRYVCQQISVSAHHVRNAFVDRKTELSGEPNCSKHTHWIFAQALRRVTNHHKSFMLYVLKTTRVVPNTEIGDVVIQRVTGEIPPPNIFFNHAVDVVTNNAAFHIVGGVVIFMIRRRTKGCYFNYFTAESNMRQSKAAADQAAVAK